MAWIAIRHITSANTDQHAHAQDVCRVAEAEDRVAHELDALVAAG